MNRESRLRELLEEIIDVAPEQRRQGLERLTDDAGLIEEALSLLEREDRFGDFLVLPAARVLADPFEETTREGRRSDIRDGPFKNWDRYQVGRLLGSGGMGDVFEAFDPRLQRQVALKILKVPDPAQLERFQREARAQARIDHSNVCQVYEVGEAEGRPYIAMQYIAGRTLGEMAGELEADDLVGVMVAVCEGIHAAHRTGLIHRDIKPGNIMIGQGERADRGVFVMDFGIAWDPGSPALTITGARLGTPLYMAPEQVSPEAGSLDRRTDVYGLGVTLYQVLTGKPLFSGDSSLEIMRRVLEQEPTPPRQINPLLSRDLETIVLKCIEKEPDRRYGSARELAEDLRRYLDGEPVLARRAGLGYKLATKARKNKILVGFVAIALIVGAVVAIRVRMQLRARAEVAQRFSRDVESLEWIQLASHQMPLHDIRPERDLLRRRMAEIEKHMSRLGKLGRGPGLYALGRGYLALQDYQKAEENLTQAWEAGFRAPEIADALGRTLGELYGVALAEARRLPDPAARASRRRQIESRYREPALRYLREGRASVTEAPQLTEALIAFYEERFGQAVDQARAAVAAIPWLYTGYRIEGDARLAEATNAESYGDYQRAVALYAEAETAYRKAAAIGESDPETHLALCRLGRPRVLLASNHTGTPLEPLVDAALQSCDHTLAADPERAEALIERASLLSYQAEAAMRFGADPGETLGGAEAAARRAIGLAPRSPEAHLALGLALSVKFDRLSQIGSEARSALDESIVELERVIELDPTFDHAYHLLALGHLELARDAERNNADPAPLLDRAAGFAEQTLKLLPEGTNTHLGLSMILYQRARLAERRGQASAPILERGIEVLRQALSVDPHLGFAYVNLGVFLHRMAKVQLRDGVDPRPQLAEAKSSLETALKHYPNDAFAFFNLGHIQVTAARYQAGTGGDALPWLEAARRDFGRGIEIAPGRSGPRASLGEVWLLEALWLERLGSDPSRALKQAAAGATASLAALSTDVEGLRLAVKVAVTEGRRQAGESQADSAFARARGHVEQALKHGGAVPETRIELAALELEEAWHALESGRAPDAHLKAGLEIVDALLAVDPALAPALGLKGGLLFVESRTIADRARRLARQDDARRLLDQALARDPGLVLELGATLGRIAAGDLIKNQLNGSINPV